MLRVQTASRSPAKRGLILLDTCESGAAVTGASRNGAAAALGKRHEATGRFVITAANVSQAALEGYRDRHGVFTAAILDALLNGDANGNGTIEVSELADCVQATVPEFSNEMRAKGSRGIALGYASQDSAEHMAIPAKGEAVSAQEKASAQKSRTGSRREDFPLVNKMAVSSPQCQTHDAFGHHELKCFPYRFGCLWSTKQFTVRTVFNPRGFIMLAPRGNAS